MAKSNEKEAERLATKDYINRGVFGGFTRGRSTKYFDFTKAKNEHLKRLNGATK